MARFRAVLDANVLVPVVLADTLLRIAEAGLFRPLWSDRILDETVSALEHVHPNLRETGDAHRRVAIMNEHFPDARVNLPLQLRQVVELPDPNDAHVVSTALLGRADVIVTSNLKDFPNETLEPFGIEAQSPDEFLLNHLELDAALVMTVLLEQAIATRRPPLSVEDVIGRLERSGAQQFAKTAMRQLWRLPNRP